MLETIIGYIIKGLILILIALFVWKIEPLIKDTAIAEKAYKIVHLMEEVFGGGNGEAKFSKAVCLLQLWVNKIGWKVDVADIADFITTAVGELHAEQGKVPEKLPFDDAQIADEAE